MKIIFAQGNPGQKFERSRHNTGFMVLDWLAESYGARWRSESKFRAQITELPAGAINPENPEAESSSDEKILLVKPQSFYNETGTVARSLVDFYKLDARSDILVIHDELALPFGTIRVRQKGSDAGNNGIKSLNSHLGPDYARIRIGVWNELQSRIDDADFVLSSFSDTELKQLEELAEQAIKPLILQFINGTLESTSFNKQ